MKQIIIIKQFVHSFILYELIACILYFIDIFNAIGIIYTIDVSVPIIISIMRVISCFQSCDKNADFEKHCE